MDMSRLNTNWIWTPEWNDEDEKTARIVYFRKSFTLEDKTPEENIIRISADSRYKLYVNGNFVQEGPQKALSLKEWFVDSADIAPYLREGENVIAAEVLRYPAMVPGKANANDSLLRTAMPNLFVDDGKSPEEGSLAAKAGWVCCVNRDIKVFSENGRPAPIHAQEDACASEQSAFWKMPGYDDSAWQAAVPYSIMNISMADAPCAQAERTIPPMAHEERRFEGVPEVRECGGEDRNTFAEKAGAMLKGTAPLEIPANSSYTFEISAGEEECGYLLYSFAGGNGAKISTLCSECYSYPQPPRQTPFGMMPVQPKKGDRTDAENGQLLGHTSYYTVAGYGSEDAPETYEPFWFRTFRYIQLKIETAGEPLSVTDLSYRTTGYPLDVRTSFEASDPDYAGIWDICVRTLRRCMHETYMDCPFYEQLQYAMDGRSEILYTYLTGADDRLARQAMEAFRLSQRPDGLIQADAPTLRSNVIPGFSIYYVLMVYDHMMYFGDREFIKIHLPAIEGVMNFFARSINENGLVGRVGGPMMRHRYWSFIDWASGWDSGVPQSSQKGSGSITMESLLYLYGLQKAAEIAQFAGNTSLAGEYMKNADSLKAAIRANCMGSAGGRALIQEGPGIDDYSVHCQVFAILCGVVSPEEGKMMLQSTVGHGEYPQASVAFMFYLFRALEICGWYEKTDELWDLWRNMLKNNMTTCVENDTDERSDCHAWASLMCYEMPAAVLGVQPAEPGFGKVRIEPQTACLDHAEGNVITPKGNIYVSWKKDADGNIDLSYELPEGIEIAEK